MLRLHIQTAEGAFDLEIEQPDEFTLGALKEQLAGRTGIPWDALRLVVEGRRLQDDQQTLSHLLNFSDSSHGIVVHVARSTTTPIVRSPTTPSAQQSPSFGTSFPGGVDAMLPLMQNMLNQQPDLMQSILMSNPQMQHLMEENPELAQMIRQPQFLQQMTEVMQKPQLMQELQRQTDRALSQLDVIPGGFQHLQKIYKTIQEPMEEGMNASQKQLRGKQEEHRNKELARRLNVLPVPDDRVNDQALPNPWDRRPAGTAAGALATTNPTFTNPMSAMFADPSLSGLFPFATMSGMAGSPFPNTSHEQVQPLNPFAMNSGIHTNRNTSSSSTSSSTQWMASYERQYEAELQRMEEMGFRDRALNIRALLASGGQVERALLYLLQQPPSSS